MVTSVTSDNLDDLLHGRPQAVSVVAAAAVKAANRHVKWVDMDSHGYGVLDVTAERSQMDYYVVSNKMKRDASSAWTRSYRTLSGTPTVERVDRPVRWSVHFRPRRTMLTAHYVATAGGVFPGSNGDTPPVG